MPASRGVGSRGAGAPTLARVLDAMAQIAPLDLAAEWDNVGLLVDPRGSRRRVERAMLTIDLTETVVAEARRARAELVIAYHPAIFRPFKRLGQSDGKERAVLAAVAAGIAVYSPHTALDGVAGGIADWLADGVLAGDEPNVRRPAGEGDFGRVVELPKAIPFSRLVARTKHHLGRKHLQVARPQGQKAIRSIAVAAGAGGGVVLGERVDAIVTGEMSHHDALAATAAGTSVVLAGHSNTERGYLTILRRRLRRELGTGIRIELAKSDRDPLDVI
ncbi:MAG: Nif3-like dinuclear metal center hexameric protein [bacterium]|nr:Nif3-like dinuclear metal center hexameric protein [bacterium]